MNTNAAPAVGSGFSETSQFKMDMNGKAARILSDTLYEDKHGSIVRELCSNAYDAHKMVGKEDEPFDVTLPDPFSPMLTIRDYGPGISPEDIDTVYSTYFASTKDASNDSVGMFGLGSKTPFSLTDAFVVTSIHKGVKRVYNAYMHEDVPSIGLFGEPEQTDEPDGLEVSITVEKKDIAAFRDAITQQLRFFPTKPNVSPSVTWPEITEVLLEVDGFQYFKHNHNLLRGFFIKTGPVAYPLNFDKLEAHYKNNDMRVPELIKFMRQTAENRMVYGYYGRNNNSDKGAILDMPIGTVEVTPSREGLSYSDHTLENLVDAIEGIKTKLFDTIRNRLHDEYNKGYKAFIEYYNNLDDMMLESINSTYVEKNFDPFVVVHGKLSIKMPEKFVGLEVKNYQSKWGRSTAELLNSTKLAQGWMGDKNNYSEDANGNIVYEDYENTKQYRNSLTWLVGSDSLFFLQDENYAFAQRSLDYWRNSAYHGIYYVLKADNCDASLKDVEDFMSQFISGEMVYLSDTPKPSKASGAGFSTTGGQKRSWFDLTEQRITSPFELYEHTLYKLNAISEFDKTAEDIKDDDTDSYIFFTTFNNRVNAPETGRYITQILFNYIQRYKDDGTKIIAVPKNQRKKYDKMQSTIHVDDYIKKYGNEIRAALRKDMNMIFVNKYNREVIQQRNRNCDIFDRFLVNGDYVLSDLDFDFDNWSTNAVLMLAYMNDYEMSLAMKDLDAKDLYKELETNKETWDNIDSMSEAETFLNKLGVDFVSFKDKLDTLAVELVNKDNRVAFLNDMIRGNDGFTGNTRILDPLSDKADALLNLRELAGKLVSQLA